MPCEPTSRDYIVLTLLPVLTLIEDGSNIIPPELREPLKGKIERLLDLIEELDGNPSEELDRQARELLDILEAL